ncbi:probable disease resistance protein At4g27220 isoform X2 [Citrus clementina]|uniref:probable disease resistance protein At4g27220 isoform X2 n=1 Tax=Citrus clementina TaxID=85681 RepID=UPI000CED0871|nr:probable disease resistance protein At4g27220 isoform X2 [Citrus x clementina]
MVDSVVAFVLQVAKCLAPLTERQFCCGSNRNYTSTFENLMEEVQRLRDVRLVVRHRIEEAERNDAQIVRIVEEWLATVDEFIAEAEMFVKDENEANKGCFKGMSPNLKTRRRLSKEAKRKLNILLQLREAAASFDRICYRTIPEDTWLISRTGYEAFGSRASTLDGIVTALKSPDVNMLGIYGMAGIGKTTLAKEVARVAMNDRLFDQVVFAELSPFPDIRMIQERTADGLGVIFHEESLSGRADRLHHRLMQEKTILIILDNIWDRLDLAAVGIPLGDYHRGCKVLLTTRSLDVLSGMGSQPNFFVEALNEEEAWSLFAKIAGDDIHVSEFNIVARDVAKTCAGLPLLIVMVASALRNKRLFEWMDALQQARNFEGTFPTVFSAIELSYNHLQEEELKKIFLLIAYTYIASVDELLMYGMGLGLFEGINNMEEAKCRVHMWVDKLKASCLLLDHVCKDENHFSMHDVVRDVAIAIASRDLNVLRLTDELVNRWEWLDDSEIKLSSSIILHGVKTNKLPEVLDCPLLELFSISADKYSKLMIPDNLFTRMIKVRVLVLTNCMHLFSLPSSLGLLKNLRILCLCYCNLEDISVIGDLKTVEILSLKGSNIEQLPVEIGELTQLRLLDLRTYSELKVIPPNVLSKLSHLEELYIGDSFNKWEVEGLNNASLDELKHLPNLTSLELQIKDVNTLPRGLFFEKLERYKICVGDEWHWRDWLEVDVLPESCREFRLQLNTKICFKDGLIVQLQGIEVLCLSGLQDFKNFFDELLKVGSSQLKHLSVQNCYAPNLRESEMAPSTSQQREENSTASMRSNETILEDGINVSNRLFTEQIVVPNLETMELYNINVERIWQNKVAAASCGIQNLTHLTVYNCRNLRCLLQSSTVSSFVRLQQLFICGCPVLDEIIVVDQDLREKERKDNRVMFPQLKILNMEDLGKLTRFCAGDEHIEFPSLEQLEIKGCPEFMMDYKSTTHDLTEKVFPNLEVLRVEAKNIPTIWEFPEDFFCKLKCLEVVLDESTIIFSLDFLQRFHTMKILKVRGAEYDVVSNEKVENGSTAIIREVNKRCDLKHILEQVSSNMDNLVILEVCRCENLINLVPSSTSFQNLTNLVVWNCDKLINVVTISTAKSLVKLKEMRISQCNKITEIVVDGGDAAKDEIIFSNLKVLWHERLTSLTSFYSGNRTFKFPSLQVFIVDKCPNMKIFSQGEISTPKLSKVQLRWDDKNYGMWKSDLNTTIQQLHLK